MTDEPRRRRSARGPRPARSTASHRHLRNPFTPARVFTDDQVAHVHEQALVLLRDHGVKVLLPDARRRFAEAGAVVDPATEMVRFDPAFVVERRWLAAPPSSRSRPATAPTR